MDGPGPEAFGPSPAERCGGSVQKKTSGLKDGLEYLFGRCRGAFGDGRSFERARTLMLSELLCLGRHTLSGLLTTCGQEGRDWSASYRLFERARFDCRELFAVSREAVLERLPENSPLVVLMDDTLLRKRGHKVAGASWRRDPLGPHFTTNFIWAQRFLQISCALPESDDGPSRARGIPVAFQSCPSPKKPGRQALPQDWERYREQCRQSAISRRAVEELQTLRAELDADPKQAARILVAAVDGTFTNRTVIAKLPAKTVLLGRIRKDAKLHALPEAAPVRRGRRRVYGSRLPTPEQLRQDQSVPWQKVQAYAAGKVHEFQLKTMGACRWKKAGAKVVRIVVIRPLGYRPAKGHRILYRQPAYLVCTDPEMPLERIIQYYVWRWEIELNFRDEKTLLGVGEAQVRTPTAVQTVPQFKVAAYSLLLAAAECCTQNMTTPPKPKWNPTPPRADQRITTQQMIAALRAETWSRSLGTDNYAHFVKAKKQPTTMPKIADSAPNAVIYAFR